MRVSSYAVARPAFYDRSAVSLVLDGSVNGIAPHGFTTRYTQTCPAASKYVVEIVTNQAYRNSAPTVSGQVFLFTRIVNAASTFAINVNFFVGDMPTAGVLVGTNLPCTVTMYPAEVIASLTQDASTGGTLNYVQSAKITQYAQ